MKQFKRGLWSQENQDHQRAFREQAFKLEDMVPPRNVADQLLQLYLETFETTYRVLHVPTFVSVSGAKNAPGMVLSTSMNGATLPVRRNALS